MKLGEYLKTLGPEEAKKKLSALSPQELKWVEANLDVDVGQPEQVVPADEGKEKGFLGQAWEAIKGAGKYWLGKSYTQPAEIGYFLQQFAPKEAEKGEMPQQVEEFNQQGQYEEMVPLPVDAEKAYRRAKQLESEGARQLGQGTPSDILRALIGFTTPATLGTLGLGGIPMLAGAEYMQQLGEKRRRPSLRESIGAALNVAPLLLIGPIGGKVSALAKEGIGSVAPKALSKWMPSLAKTAVDIGETPTLGGLLKESLGVGIGATLAGEPFRAAASMVEGVPYRPGGVSDVATMMALDLMTRGRGEVKRLKAENELSQAIREAAKAEKTPATFIGMQETPDGEVPLANTPDGSTHVYDPSIHEVAPEEAKIIEDAIKRVGEPPKQEALKEEAPKEETELPPEVPPPVYKEKVKLKETGEVVTVERDAREVLKERQEKLRSFEEKMRKFTECMGG